MTSDTPPDLEIRGYYSGVVGEITAAHARYYARQWGFDVSFETQVGIELSRFVAEFNADHDGLWAAVLDERFAGSIAVDGTDAQGEGARLRWLIVRPGLQEQGIGRALLNLAMRFCRQRGFPQVFLWTFEGLDRARALYEHQGFRLVEQHRVPQWGKSAVNEQKFLWRPA